QLPLDKAWRHQWHEELPMDYWCTVRDNYRWTKPGGINGMRNCRWITGAPFATKICPANMVATGMNYNGYGSGYSDHDVYCCEVY
ncbi:hypothetical protein, partial [Pseudomonas aeruginosa]|uniref:hypothetical protein n=1 Tax=Pseudomonas aeruginosa TaxID=287 RepID=UPI001EE6E583